MRKTMYKLFWAWENEKEEKWLNEMSALGLQLVSVSLGTYHFEESVPGEYIYRIELLPELPSHPKSLSYIRFLEDTGVEHIATLMRWVYFRKKSSEGPFELYCDLDSRIRQNNIIITLMATVLPLITMSTFTMVSGYIAVRSSAQLVMALLCLLLLLYIAWGLWSVVRKNNRLKNEKKIRE